MRKLRALAVDDEPLALQRLAWSLADFPEVELVGQSQSGSEALELVRTLRPNLLLLDIDMPPPGGLDVVAALDPAQPLEVVFVTAFDEYAVRAFELSATDYLLKPVVRARLEQALARARARLEARETESRVSELQEIVAQLRKARHAPAAPQYLTEFWVAERDARVRIPAHKVERIEAYGDYVRLYVGDRERLMRATLGDLAGRLDPGLFVRIHRSQIVRKDRITALRRKATGRVHAVLADGSEHPVSRSQLPVLREKLGH
ncbi:MAG TPA: LytTR family DNA-binding domain-containing protein [Steroidobacteraceae bacterium]|nr:LytTR family DNA-binding domain-containing protein [Steroidobacteraceae bacterium]